MFEGRYRIAAFALAFVVAVTAIGLVRSRDRELPDPGDVPRATSTGKGDDENVELPKQAYLRDACKMPAKWAQRIHRGWDPGPARSHDLVIVPSPRNYMGSFLNTSHSAPYDFLQKVPLVLYGPGFVDAQGRVEIDGREPTIADLAPTYAELMDFDFRDGPSEALTEVLREDAKEPKLIFTAVIDGGGWNALEEWPDAWPNIQRLIDDGANIEGAVVGSSPSITPATHTNLSTGTFPRYHGVTAIAIRADDGSLVGSFSRSAGNPLGRATDPTVSLKKTTLADEWDLANDNEAKIGMLAAGNLQAGMIGHGTALEGGDADIMAVRYGETWETNPDFYSLPDYVNTEVEGPAADLDELDRSDGAADGKWMGHSLDDVALDASPAFAPWQNRTMQALLDGEDFGRDSVTDLFYVNYKAPDKAGHEWNMIAPEQEEVIRSVDTALGDMVSWLDENVGRDEYLFVVTADHGQTPLEAGGWPILGNELVADIDAHFGVEGDASLIQRTSASSFFSDKAEMKARGVTPEQVASFVSRYRIGDNIPEGEEVPAGYEERLDERIFDAAFPGRELNEVVACTEALSGG